MGLMISMGHYPEMHGNVIPSLLRQYREEGCMGQGGNHSTQGNVKVRGMGISSLPLAKKGMCIMVSELFLLKRRRL